MSSSFQLDAMALYKRMRAQAAGVAWLKPEPVPNYSAYNVAAVELENRIAEVRALPKDQQPQSLLEGLVMLGVPVTIKQ
jgi:hypothetical protein